VEREKRLAYRIEEPPTEVAKGGDSDYATAGPVFLADGVPPLTSRSSVIFMSPDGKSVEVPVG
jgi:hypothetical protein